MMTKPEKGWQPVWLKRAVRRASAILLARYVRYRGRAGLPAIQRDGDRLGRLHYLFSYSQRRKLQPQVARLFDTRPDDPEITALLKTAWRINDRAAIEALARACGAVTVEEVSDSVVVTDIEPLIATLEANQGAILLGIHSGNVLALLLKLARLGLPISVIANQPRRVADGFFEGFFVGTSVEVIRARPESRAFYGLNKALKQGRAAYIPIDQIHKRGGVPARFLGKQVPMPGGTSVLARRYGTPIYPVLLEAAEPKWKFRIGKAILLPADQERQRDMAELAAVVDAHIRRQPQLWSWHHRRWMRYPFA